MTDLLSYADGGPGWKGKETSREAAKKIAPKSGDLRERCYRLILSTGPHGLTADECADMLGVHFMKVRPRCTELAKPQHGEVIKDSGRTRPSSLGNPQTVWVAA